MARQELRHARFAPLRTSAVTKAPRRLCEFPEVDRAAWFTPAEARAKILRGQVGFVDALERRRAGSGSS